MFPKSQQLARYTGGQSFTTRGAQLASTLSHKNEAALSIKACMKYVWVEITLQKDILLLKSDDPKK